jgi:hypothetical protein
MKRFLLYASREAVDLAAYAVARPTIEVANKRQVISFD